MIPTMIHPSGARLRRRYPYSRRPHVRTAIPAMIPTLIDIAGLRSSAAHLDHRARRRHLHNNLSAHRADRQQAAGKRSKNCSSHFFPFTDRAAPGHFCFAMNFAKIFGSARRRPTIADQQDACQRGAGPCPAMDFFSDKPGSPANSARGPRYKIYRNSETAFTASGLRQTRSRARDAPSDDPPIGHEAAAAQPTPPAPTRARAHPSDDTHAGRHSLAEEPCRAPQPPHEAAPLAR
jgi:hypothetical protein